MMPKFFFVRLVLVTGMLFNIFGNTDFISAASSASVKEISYSGTAYDPGNPAYTDIWVDPVTGNDSTHNGASPAAAFRTLTRAWNSIPMTNPLTHAVRINLQPGTYTVSMMPNYWETRYGTAAAPIMIRGNGAARADVLLQGSINMYEVHYIYFENLSIVLDGDAFHCELCDHLLLRNMLLNGGAQQAQETIKINQSQYVYIENNDISGAWDNAIDFVSVQYGHILNNQIHNAGDWCAYTKGGSAYLLIEANTIYDCGTGGFTAGQGTGFQFMTSPWIQYEAYDIKIVNNVIHDTDGAGLGVNGGYNVLMAYNTMYRVGTRDHVLEMVFGSRSCDGSPGDPGRERCLQYLNQGGWGTTIVSDGNNYIRIPNKNIFVYNNVIYNPPGVQSMWQHFAIYDPYTNPPNSHVATAVTDENLQIRGNVIWNGDLSMPLGIEDNTQACITNTTCNATQLVGENAINLIQPHFVDPAATNFHLTGTWANTVTTYTIPDFPAWDISGVAAGNISNAVPTDFEGTTRAATNPPGAYYLDNSLLVSVLRANPNPTNASSVNFNVTFSNPVTGVDTVAPFNDFAVISALGASITSVTATSTSAYTVTVNTGSGDGTIHLNVLDSGAIEDANHNTLHGTYISGQTYTIDRTSPTVSSIARAQPSPTNAITVDFNVSFNEPVAGVTASDFSLNLTGVTGAYISNVNGSGATRTVTVNTGNSDGTLRLDILSESGITDLVGNQLSGGFTSGEEYTIRYSPPNLLIPVNAATLNSYRPTFDWSDVSAATGYNLQVSKSNTFRTLLWNKNITPSAYTATVNLPANTLLYWRVRSMTGRVYGLWSRQVSTFITPPVVPKLIAPANNALLSGTSPLFIWTNALLPSGLVFDSFQIQVATDIYFTNLVHNNVVVGITNSQDASAVLPLTGAAYYWRVRSVSSSNPGFASPWSLVRKLMLKFSMPVLIAPANLNTSAGNLPTFTWNPVNGAKNYTIEIAKNPAFTGKIARTVSVPSYTPTIPLLSGVTYYWRVKVNGNYVPVYSTVWNFVP